MEAARWPRSRVSQHTRTGHVSGPTHLAQRGYRALSSASAIPGACVSIALAPPQRRPNRHNPPTPHTHTSTHTCNRAPRVRRRDPDTQCNRGHLRGAAIRDTKQSPGVVRNRPTRPHPGRANVPSARDHRPACTQKIKVNNHVDSLVSSARKTTHQKWFTTPTAIAQMLEEVMADGSTVPLLRCVDGPVTIINLFNTGQDFQKG